MSYKIFISYKYADSSVESIIEGDTPRAYVTKLQEDIIGKDNINKGEKDDEDLSLFKDTTIKTKLKEKIKDSSITIVLISPCMKEISKSEKDQWIPWEISYSLRDIYGSEPNGMLGVVLPSKYNNYDYFMNNWSGYDADGNLHHVTRYNSENTFNIIQENMFNQINPEIKYIDNNKVFFGDSCYIPMIKWDEFIKDPEKYLDKSNDIRINHLNEYDLHKII